MFYKPAVHRPALLVLYVPRARLARVVRLDFALFVLEDSRKEPSPCNAVRIILLLVGLAFQDYKDFFIFSPYLSLRLPFQFSFRLIDVPPRLVPPPPNAPSLASSVQPSKIIRAMNFTPVFRSVYGASSSFRRFLKYRRFTWDATFREKVVRPIRESDVSLTSRS